MQLNHERLCALIPHSGTMCLLDSVIEWNEQEIHCRAISQTDADNPLREAGTLAAIHGVEYAAQAMAVHGALLSSQNAAPAIGYLAALRSVTLNVDDLQQEPELHIHCTRLGGDRNGFIYQFEVHGSHAALLSGRATVINETGNAA